MKISLKQLGALPILVFLMCFLCTSAPGQVLKSVRSYRVEDKDTVLEGVKQYNPKGQLVFNIEYTEAKYSEGGDTTSYISNFKKYDEEGHLVVDSVISKQFGPAELVMHKVHNYDAFGRLHTVLSFSDDCKDGQTTETYFYNHKGQLTDLRHETECEKVISHRFNTHYEYDPRGNKTLEMRKDLINSGKIVYKYTYAYDANGYLIKESQYFGNRENDELKPFWIYDYEYDAKGRLILKRVNRSGSEHSIQYGYDPKGNLTTEGHMKYQYDQHGNKIKKTFPCSEEEHKKKYCAHIIFVNEYYP